jgi:hypothetical protein
MALAAMTTVMTTATRRRRHGGGDTAAATRRQQHERELGRKTLFMMINDDQKLTMISMFNIISMSKIHNHR